MPFSQLQEVYNAFDSEERCLNHLESLLWNGIPKSPFAPNSKVYFCNGNKYKCRETGKYFNVKTNTIFHNSKIGLQKWFAAIWILSSGNKAITSVQLAKDLGITQKTAWHMMRRIKMHFDLKIPAAITTAIKTEKEIEKIEVIIEQDKLKMSEWLNLLKK